MMAEHVFGPNMNGSNSTPAPAKAETAAKSQDSSGDAAYDCPLFSYTKED
jgi:hypothetical protein